MQEARRALDLEAGRPGLDEEEQLLALVHGGDDVDARLAFARDEPLLAVQHPLVAVADGRRRERGEIRAGARLGQRPRLAVLAADDRHHVPLDLLGGEQLEQLARARGRRPRSRGRSSPCPTPPRARPAPSIERSRPPSSSGMFSIEKPGGARLRAQRVDLGRVDRVALDDPLLDGIDLGLDEAADWRFSSAISAGSSGTITDEPPGCLTVRSGIVPGSVPHHGSAARRISLRRPQPARERAVHQRRVPRRVLAAGVERAGRCPGGGAGRCTSTRRRPTGRRPRSRARRRPAASASRGAAGRARRARSRAVRDIEARERRRRAGERVDDRLHPVVAGRGPRPVPLGDGKHRARCGGASASGTKSLAALPVPDCRVRGAERLGQRGIELDAVDHARGHGEHDPVDRGSAPAAETTAPPSPHAMRSTGLERWTPSRARRERERHALVAAGDARADVGRVRRQAGERGRLDAVGCRRARHLEARPDRLAARRGRAGGGRGAPRPSPGSRPSAAPRDLGERVVHRSGSTPMPPRGSRSP